MAEDGGSITAAAAARAIEDPYQYAGFVSSGGGMKMKVYSCAYAKCSSLSVEIKPTGAASEEKRLLLCSRCREVRYCSAACQKGHWPFHKGNCNFARHVQAFEELIQKDPAVNRIIRNFASETNHLFPDAWSRRMIHFRCESMKTVQGLGDRSQLASGGGLPVDIQFEDIESLRKKVKRLQEGPGDNGIHSVTLDNTEKYKLREEASILVSCTGGGIDGSEYFMKPFVVKLNA